jgi:serine/threonine-protein kinase
MKEAIAEYHEAIRLQPDYAGAHSNLGLALCAQGNLEEAIAEYHKAIRLQPDLAEAHCNLGGIFKQQGRFTEALAELERGHDLGSKRPDWRFPSAEWVRQARLLVQLESRLPALLQGNDRPANPDEMLTLADLCYRKQLHAASARFWQEVFQNRPTLAEDILAGNRYNAACAAALAGSGKGKDEPPLEEEAKARWRTQARDWLKADLAAWAKGLESGPLQVRPPILQTLQRSKEDTDLAGIRGDAAIARLPADEQHACRALWSEVDALLARTRGNPSP